VEVSDNEGLANYVVPESCAVCRETCGEALTGVRSGQPLSHDSLYIPSADAVDTAEGNTTGAILQVPRRLGVVEDPGTHAPCTGIGRSPVWPVAVWTGPHREGEEP
jgi:hypothetical protein